MHTVGSVAYAVSIGYWGVFVQKKERELRREAERRDGKPEKYAKSGDEVYNELLRRHLWCGCCSLAWVHLLMVWLLLACVGASAYGVAVARLRGCICLDTMPGISWDCQHGHFTCTLVSAPEVSIYTAAWWHVDTLAGVAL